jgi:Ni,Fe-hydrogenase maturation factor
MTVDRSYSSYEAIRNYQDRGMMKWGAFATGELSEAQNHFEDKQKKDKVIHTLSPHQILHLLNQSYLNQVQVKISYHSKEQVSEIYGFVSEFINNQVRIKSTDSTHLISVEQIINIFGSVAKFENQTRPL